MGDSFTTKELRHAHPFFGPCGHGFGHPQPTAPVLDIGSLPYNSKT